jgi:hypothetical protein
VCKNQFLATFLKHILLTSWLLPSFHSKRRVKSSAAYPSRE